MSAIQTYSLFFSILCIALITGLFYGYSCSVNPGLAALDDKEYLKAMQSINKAILNPLFFISFIGSLIILPLTAWFLYSPPLTTKFYCLLFSTVIYIFGVFMVTMFANVPLNTILADFSIDTATVSEISSQRLRFEASWNTFHSIRTVAAVISLSLSIIATLIK